jgi:hypothetical protein
MGERECYHPLVFVGFLILPLTHSIFASLQRRSMIFRKASENLDIDDLVKFSEIEEKDFDVWFQGICA